MKILIYTIFNVFNKINNNHNFVNFNKIIKLIIIQNTLKLWVFYLLFTKMDIQFTLVVFTLLFILYISNFVIVNQFDHEYYQIYFSELIQKKFNYEKIIFQKQLDGSMIIVLHCSYRNILF